MLHCYKYYDVTALESRELSLNGNRETVIFLSHFLDMRQAC